MRAGMLSTSRVVRFSFSALTCSCRRAGRFLTCLMVVGHGPQAVGRRPRREIRLWQGQRLVVPVLDVVAAANDRLTDLSRLQVRNADRYSAFGWRCWSKAAALSRFRS